MCSYQGKPWEVREAVLAGEEHAAPWAGAAVSGGPGTSQEIMQVSEELAPSQEQESCCWGGGHTKATDLQARWFREVSVRHTELFPELQPSALACSQRPWPRLAPPRTQVRWAWRPQVTGSEWFRKKKQIGEPQARGIALLRRRVRGACVPVGPAGCSALANLT